MATATIPVRREKKRKASRVWWHVHQWVGLKLAILMSFICLTGTLAVVSHEMDWLMLPSLRVAPSSVAAGEPDWNRIVASATAYPGVERVQFINEPTASAFAVKAMVVWQDQSIGYLHLHPTTGKVQGVGHWVGAARILRNMHRHLNLPGNIGIPLVTSLSFLMLVTLGTSFVVYKKWWRGFWKAPRGRDARTWWGDFHRLAGVWTLWFVALIALTGLWYFVEQMGGRADVPRVKEVAEFSTVPAEVGNHFAPALAAARKADPELHIQGIRLPNEKSGAYVFEGEKSAVLVRPRANSVWVEAATGKVLAKFDGTDLDVHQRISEMADPLHFGYFGGYWTKAIWTLFGGLLTALSVSGMAIYTLRIGRELKQVTPFRAGWQRVWLGMGYWRWIATACVVVSFIMLPTLFWASAE
jgi:uncharacterized iron-regulated membrane protein